MAEPVLARPLRRDRKQQRNREALIDAAYYLMSRDGPDAVTMLQISEHADFGAGTVYNYFSSKDDLAVAVMDIAYLRLAERIHQVTEKFDDPVDSYVYSIRATMITAASSKLWTRLLSRSVAAAEVMVRVMGPLMVPDLKKVRGTGIVKIDNPELTWQLMTHAIIGFGIEVRQNSISMYTLDQSLVILLGMAGLEHDLAVKKAAKSWPPLPSDSDSRKSARAISRKKSPARP